MIPGFNFSLAQALGFVCLALFTACIWFKAEADDANRQVSELKLEQANRKIEDQADDSAREVANASRDDLERILRRFLRESANAPLAEACRADPAFGRAYDTIDGMRRAHEDALRAAGAPANRTARVPGADGKPRR